MKVAFLDRDGVINTEVNYLHKVEDFQYTPNCIEGLIVLRDLGYKFIVVTNQAGIARGYYTEEIYEALTTWYVNDLKDKGIEILKVYHCPHHPNGKVISLAFNCECRKPKPGMILEAIRDFNVDTDESLLIGDKVSDIEAAKSANIKQSFLVETGHKVDNELFSTYPDILSIAKEISKYEP